jgi:hypothetical protein
MSGALLCLASSATGQTPTPSPTPLPQDQLTLQARLNVVQGSGARALGMGGAFLARADDATAASWNPAGLSYLRLPEVSFVYSGGNLNSRATNPTTTDFSDDRRHGSSPDFLAATYPLSVGPLSGSAQLSFQRVIAFTTDRTIDDHFIPAPPGPGEAASPPFVRRSTITTKGGFDVLALGSGWQLTRTIRAGATLNRWFNGYEQVYDKPVALGISHQEFRYDLRAWNVNVGVIWTPTEKLNIGAVYKTGFEGRLEQSRLRRDPLIVSGELVIRERTATSEDLELDPRLGFPPAIGIGASFRPRSTLTLSMDYTRTRWSEGFIRDFFDLGSTGNPTPFPRLSYPTLDFSTPKDTEQIRAGLEYVVIRGRLRLPLRLGYFNDKQYFRSIPSYVTIGGGPPLATNGAPRFDALTAGAGIIAGPLLLDVAYNYEHGSYTDIDARAVVVRSHRVIASIIYRHNRH